MFILSDVYLAVAVVIAKAPLNSLMATKRLAIRVSFVTCSYAIDWEPNHGRVRVMLGRGGKMVCTLKVDSKYSIGQGQVQLLGVEGGSNRGGMQQLQVGLCFQTQARLYERLII